MENFTAYNPTRLHFGKNCVENLGFEARALGNKALLVYGKGSVLRNGSYHDTVEQLKKNNIEFIEYNGIKPNPVVTDVDEAARIGRKANVDMVIAVGGGSVIDSAKIIAVCISENVEGWDVMTWKHTPASSLPLITVLTLAATGTEMNPTAVLQNHETGQKIGFRHQVMSPVHSFLDPGYTKSVPLNYTAYGVVDLVVHALEAWFGKGEAPLSDRIVISIIKEAMVAGPALVRDLENYELRERIMWAATLALNDSTLHGRSSGDWGTHGLGHILSYLYDTAHGATLSIMLPAWLKQVAKRDDSRIKVLGKALFNSSSADACITGLVDFFIELGSPVKAQEAGIKIENKKEILESMIQNSVSGMNIRLDRNDLEEICEEIFIQ